MALTAPGPPARAAFGLLWAGGSWIDFLCALLWASRGLPGASLFSPAALARAIITSRLSLLLSFIPSETNQLLGGRSALRCGVSQSAFDSICSFIKSDLVPTLLSLTWIYLFSLALLGHINLLCLVPNFLCIS